MLTLIGLLLNCSIVIDVCAGFGYRLILFFEKVLDKLEGKKVVSQIGLVLTSGAKKLARLSDLKVKLS
jgi:hypothetical protein